MGAEPMTSEELDALEALAKATPETVEAVHPPSVKLRTLLAVGNDVVGFVEGSSREALVAFYTRARGSTLALAAEVRRVTAERDALRDEVERLRERMESMTEECPACDGCGYGGGLNGSDRCYKCDGNGVVLR